MTILQCTQMCTQKGFHYAALQYSSHCFCGNNSGYAKYGKATNCNMACSGNKQEKCGGGWANQVYKTGNFDK